MKPTLFALSPPSPYERALLSERSTNRFPEMTQKFFTVAPMMDWTDRHCRAFHRVLSRRARLYTEMVTTGAVIHGPRERLLGFSGV